MTVYGMGLCQQEGRHHGRMWRSSSAVLAERGVQRRESLRNSSAFSASAPSRSFSPASTIYSFSLLPFLLSFPHHLLPSSSPITPLQIFPFSSLACWPSRPQPARRVTSLLTQHTQARQLSQLSLALPPRPASSPTMNFPQSDMHSFWDINAQQPDSFSALPDDDFLAFLQKQFPSAIGNNDPAPLSFDNPDGVDPQRINSFPPPNASPPSSDSSPSPPSTHHESSLSRRQSGVFGSAPSSSGNADPEDGSLKRKAVENPDEPQSKTQHTSRKCSFFVLSEFVPTTPALAPGGSNKKTVSSASARRKPGAPQVCGNNVVGRVRLSDNCR